MFAKEEFEEQECLSVVTRKRRMLTLTDLWWLKLSQGFGEDCLKVLFKRRVH